MLHTLIRRIACVVYGVPAERTVNRCHRRAQGKFGIKGREGGGKDAPVPHKKGVFGLGQVLCAGIPVAYVYARHRAGIGILHLHRKIYKSPYSLCPLAPGRSPPA